MSVHIIKMRIAEFIKSVLFRKLFTCTSCTRETDSPTLFSAVHLYWPRSSFLTASILVYKKCLCAGQSSFLAFFPKSVSDLLSHVLSLSLSHSLSYSVIHSLSLSLSHFFLFYKNIFSHSHTQSRV